MADINSAPLGTVMLARWGTNTKWLPALVKTINGARVWHRWSTGIAVAQVGNPVDWMALPVYAAPAPVPAPPSPPVVDDLTPASALLGPFKHYTTVVAMGAHFAAFEKAHTDGLASHAGEEILIAGKTGLDRIPWYYYDRAAILYREAIRSGSPLVLTARAQKVAVMYRDVLPNFDQPMNWSFPQGLALHHLKANDPKTLTAIARLATNARAPYYLDALDGIPVAGEDNTDNRTQARVLEHFIVAHFVNAPAIDNDYGDTRPWAEMAKWSLDRILLSQNSAGDFAHRLRQKSPFMVGILHEALILYGRLIGSDPRILAAIRNSAEFIWQNHWRAGAEAFVYDPGQFDGTADDLKPAPDLNMLIAPSFAWLHYKTGEQKWLERCHMILSGGVAGAWLDGAKQFNQQYIFGHLCPARLP